MKTAKVSYTSHFVRDFNKLSLEMQNLALERIEKYKKNSKDKSLKVHKLKGNLRDKYAFSIDYSYRIIFEIVEGESRFLYLGDHSLYDLY